MTLLRDWAWHNGLRKWFLSCSLAPDIESSQFVPAITSWFVVVSPPYPLGSIKFHPAKQGGLAHTFPHQSYEKETSRFEVEWRRCSLCLDTPSKSLGRQAYTIEPYESELRLAWHCRRALAWLMDASCEELIRPGEPFELPQYPIQEGSRFSIAFSEGPESYRSWETTTEQVGFVEFYVLKREINIQVIKCFKTLDRKTVLTPEWGPAIIQGAHIISHGVWLRLPKLPVQAPWQAPLTWGDLRDTCDAQGFDLDKALQQAFERETKKDNVGAIVIVGFPISEIAGNPAGRVHWLAVELPTLLSRDAQVPGFRTGKQSTWLYNRNRILTSSRSLRWLESENWYPDQLQTRGRMAEKMISRKILLLGAGALGSTLGELLVRSGVHSMLIMDADRLEAGNLVRHTLTLNELNQFKAEAIAKRLNGISPTTYVEFSNLSFPPVSTTMAARINECEIVIDCTGNDEVLHELASFTWRNDRIFVSLSLSLRAKRLFCFAAQGKQFPNIEFRQLINPWLARDREDHSRDELPREGIGCWHPVFPARADDIWLLASAGVKWLEKVVINLPTEPQLVVFEQKLTEEGDFIGIQRH